MSAHGSIPIPNIRDRQLPNQTFWGWLKTESALFISQIITLLGIILYIYTFSYYVFGKHTPEDHKTTLADNLKVIDQTIFYSNIAVCLLFISVLLLIVRKNDVGTYHVKVAFQRIFGTEKQLDTQIIADAKKRLAMFKWHLVYYWIYAIAFYIYSLIIQLRHVHDSLYKDSFELALNTLGAYIIYCCFRLIVLSNDFLYPSGLPYQKPIWLNKNLIFTFYLSLVLVFSTTIIYSSAPILITTLRAISGILNMVAIAMLISRLDSKLIGISSLLISLISGYAVIQPLTALFADHHAVRSIAYFLAFIFKIYFFTVLIYAMQSGRMLNFFCCNGELSRRLTKGRNNKLHKILQ